MDRFPLIASPIGQDAGDWIKDIRLLKLLETLESASETGSIGIRTTVYLTLSMMAFVCGVPWLAMGSPGGPIFVFLGVIFAVLGYCSWPAHAEEQRRIDAAVKALGDEFPNELRAWGGESSLLSKEVVAFLIRSQKAKLAQADPCGVQAHRGYMVLTLGIAGIGLPLLAPFAWVIGHQDLRAMAEGKMDRSGESMTTSGRTLGAILTCLYGALVIVALLWRK